MDGKLQTEAVTWPNRWLGTQKRNGEWQLGSSGQRRGGQSRMGHLRLGVTNARDAHLDSPCWILHGGTPRNLAYDSISLLNLIRAS